MERDSKSRKWQVTINNPVEKGFTHEKIKQIFKDFKNLTYWVMSDEIGETGTYHTHFFIYCSSAVRFSTMLKRFPGAHFEMARGTCLDNLDYIYKQGKWAKEKKAETNLLDTHEESGGVPIERQGARNDIADLYDMIKDGMSNYDIMEDNPTYMMKLDTIERARQIVREEKFKNSFREIETTYIYGRTGTGKTRGVMEQYGYDKVYRVTDYDHPFDGYAGQDVVIFEEFRSSLKISDMLNYLDGYPLTLPSRYMNKVACYTKVYLITNQPFCDQYSDIQTLHPETWLAFCRRIDNIVCMNGEGPTSSKDIEGFVEMVDDVQETFPFEL